MNENELEQVEVSIEEATAAIKLMDAYDKLAANADFNLIVGQGYFNEEAGRVCSMMADPTMEDDINQRELQSQAKAIGHFRQYLIQIKRRGMIMQDGLEDNELVAQELREEA